MLKRVKKLFQGIRVTEKPSLATITIHPIEERDTPVPDNIIDTATPTLSRTPSPAGQKLEEIEEEFKSMSRELDSIHQNLGDIMNSSHTHTRESIPKLELDSAVFTFDSSSSEENSDDSMTDSAFTTDIDANSGLLESQAECIHMNNNSLQSQYEQMQQNQLYLEQQEQVYKHNQTLALQLQEQIQESYVRLNQIQQQVYYHRHELDRLAEQALSYEGIIQSHQKTIREQEERIANNHKLLAYDKHMVGPLVNIFATQPYANQIVSLALMNSHQ